MRKVLVLEDEVNIRSFVVINLQRAGYEVVEAGTGMEALDKLREYPDIGIAILDVMLPDIDGFEVCRRIREKLATPIIIATARVEEVDKIMGLDIGADDYVTKPFSFNELMARIKAHIRRFSGGVVVGAEAPRDAAIVIRGLVIDTANYQVTRDGKPIELSKTEYQLLCFLVFDNG